MENEEKKEKIHENEKKAKKKYFILTKNKEECVSLEVKEFFEDPKKYLQNNSKFIIGNNYLNKLKIPKSFLFKKQNNSLTKLNYFKNNVFDFDKNNKINDLFEKIDSKGSLSHISKNKFTLSKNKKRCISAFSPKRTVDYDLINPKKKSRNFLHSPLSLKSNIPSSPLKSIHYEYKTPKEIIDIFNKFSHKDNRNKKEETIKLLSNKNNDFINQKFLIQEKSLKNSVEEKKNFNNFSKYLSQKCKKKEENLLLNKIENYNLKKQIIKYIDKNKLLAEKLGNNYWICNLRRTKCNYKINYVNIGKNDKEPWEQIIDAGDLEVEFTNNPSTPITINKGLGIDFFKYVKKYPKLKSFNKIKVEGKNLFNQEYSNFINTIDKDKTNKFKLYKDPQENKNKSIQDMIYKENYRPLSRKKKLI